MSSAINFEELLETNADEVEAPKPIPQGTYAASVVSFEETQSNNKEKTGVIFALRLIAPVEDSVDPDELEEYGGIEEIPAVRWYVWQGKDGKSQRYPFVRFLEEVLQISMAGRTLGEGFTEAAGQQLLATIIQKPGPNGIASWVDSVAAMPDDEED